MIRTTAQKYLMIYLNREFAQEICPKGKNTLIEEIEPTLPSVCASNINDLLNQLRSLVLRPYFNKTILTAKFLN